ncbi:MAG TPA: CRTAC1 family protein, partial [Chthonomonadales bacterium]|nr:CRTAC1 family protein [Chthonomonadales bacterium]
EVGAQWGIAEGTTAFIAWTAKFLDYDNDGALDLFFTNGHTQDNAVQVESDWTYAQPMQLYHNDGRGFIQTAGGTPFLSPIVGRGAAIGDYDNDGKQDLLVVNEEGAAMLLHNQTRNSNHWIGVRLIGVKSNRDGIGARLILKTSGRTLVRDESLCGGYLSAGDPRVHFGLGSSRTVQSLTVRWPSGVVDRILAPPVDRYVTVEEGRASWR